MNHKRHGITSENKWFIQLTHPTNTETPHEYSTHNKHHKYTTVILFGSQKRGSVGGVRLTLSNLGKKKIPMCPILAPFVSMEEINSGSLKIVITH